MSILVLVLLEFENICTVFKNWGMCYYQIANRFSALLTLILNPFIDIFNQSNRSSMACLFFLWIHRENLFLETWVIFTSLYKVYARRKIVFWVVFWTVSALFHLLKIVLVSFEFYILYWIYREVLMEKLCGLVVNLYIIDSKFTGKLTSGHHGPQKGTAFNYDFVELVLL